MFDPPFVSLKPDGNQGAPSSTLPSQSIIAFHSLPEVAANGTTQKLEAVL
jgi:hypothetical protein